MKTKGSLLIVGLAMKASLSLGENDKLA